MRQPWEDVTPAMIIQDRVRRQQDQARRDEAGRQVPLYIEDRPPSEYDDRPRSPEKIQRGVVTFQL